MWYSVPAEYILDETRVPSKLLSLVNRTNAFPFMGFPAKTLLLNAPRLEKVRVPAVALNEDEPIFLYNVYLSFTHFDPAKGVPESPYRGWDLFPRHQDGLFYLATRDGETSGAAVPLVGQLREYFRARQGPCTLSTTTTTSRDSLAPLRSVKLPSGFHGVYFKTRAAGPNAIDVWVAKPFRKQYLSVHSLARGRGPCGRTVVAIPVRRALAAVLPLPATPARGTRSPTARAG